ncbi:MAG: PEGA domain-containing protein [Deltaproteobacteria bacterium]|nr:PEGA domain-containing protein [Deltaproteobacteria bacterium]
MSLRRLSLAAVIALALLGASRPGSAQTDPTEPARRQEMLRLAREADGLYRDGYFRDALERFRKAYEAFPNPKLHFALGETCWELGQLVEALRHYEAYGRDVEEREQPHNWQRARERIVKLQAQTATLHVQANLLDAEVSVDGKVVGRTPLREPIRLMPGPHVVVVGKAGYEKQVIELTLKGGEMAARTVKLLTEEEAASGRRVFQQVEGQRRAAQEKLQRSQALQRKGLRLSGWTALAAGTALLATGGTFGILTQNEKSKVEGAATGTPWSDLQPHAHRFNTYRQLFYYCAGIGAGLAVSGGVLLALGYRRSLSVERAPARLSALPALGPQHAGLVLAGSF